MSFFWRCARLASTAALAFGIFVGAGAHALAATYGPPEVVASDVNNGAGLGAVDAADDLYLASPLGDDAVELPSAGGPEQIIFTSTPPNPSIPPGEPGYGPQDVAVDSSGDVFIANSCDDDLVELPAGGGQTDLGNWFGAGCTVHGVAVDTSGDVFASSGNYVYKFSAGSDLETALAPRLYTPTSLASDSAGDVFVAEPDKDGGKGGKIVEIPAGATSVKTLMANVSPGGLAVDADNDLFAEVKDEILEFPKGNGPKVVIASGLSDLVGLAVDPAGNLFYGNGGSDEILEMPLIDARSTPTLKVSCVALTSSQRHDLALGKPVTVKCLALVEPQMAGAGAVAPSGTVGFSAAPSGAALVPASCALPATAGKTNKCVVTLTTSTEAAYTITGSYSGDATYQPVSAQSTLNAN